MIGCDQWLIGEQYDDGRCGVCNRTHGRGDRRSDAFPVIVVYDEKALLKIAHIADGLPVVAKYQHQMEGVENTEAWQRSREEERRTWLVSTPPFLDHRTIAESDPDYQEMETNPSATLEEGVAKLEMLMGRYPEDWVLKVLHASQLLQGIDPPRGETIMRTLLEDPIDSFEGHSRYGTWLKYVGGRRDEAFAVYEDALRRWPWCQQASDACVWMLTDGMTEA